MPFVVQPIQNAMKLWAIACGAAARRGPRGSIYIRGDPLMPTGIFDRRNFELYPHRWQWHYSDDWRKHSGETRRFCSNLRYVQTLEYANARAVSGDGGVFFIVLLRLYGLLGGRGVGVGF